MGLIKFKNLPSLDTPLSAENLNNNFDYLDKNVGDLNNLNTEDKTSLVNAINSQKKNYITNGKLIKCGYQVDGKDVYKKIIETTNSISMGTSSFVHGITNYKRIWLDLSESYIYAPASNLSYPFPVIFYNGTTQERIQASVQGDSIVTYADGGWGGKWTKVFVVKCILND